LPRNQESPMLPGQASTVIEHLRRSAFLPDGGGLTDGHLLECFVRQRDQAAFEALVRRHGPMVLGVCHRVLRHGDDAEDAFQATFLVLIRKAALLLSQETIGNWLYGVAYHTALKARAAALKRRAKECQVKPVPPRETGHEGVSDLLPLLDQELNRLPDKYRQAVVLCELGGRSRQEVARQLGIPEGTLSSRLATARRKLAQRLSRHGPACSPALLAATLCPNAATACVPAPLVVSTVKAAAMFAAGHAATGVISAHAAALTEGVLRAMLLTKLKSVVAVLLAVSLLCTAARVFTYHAWGEEPEQALQPRVLQAASRLAIQGKTDKEKLQGTWHAVSGEAEGKDVSEEFVKKLSIVFAGDKITLAGLVRGENEKGVEGTFKLDPTAKPKAIDINITNKEDAVGIYELEGDTLKLCIVEAANNERPSEFAGKNRQVLIVLKRQK
jgi:RNA polymerase sigma factor (sigma-70 family)